MRSRLQNLSALCAKRHQVNRAPPGSYDTVRPCDDAIRVELPTARQILDLLDPQLTAVLGEPERSDPWVSLVEDAVSQGLGILRDRDKWEKYLEPDAPSLVADRFHPWVWQAAAPLWDTGMYRVAVGAAARSLSARIASKARSHLSDRKLVADVLSTRVPEPGRVRLHVPGANDSETWRSRQEGLHLMAQGAYAGIRNIAVHEDEAWSEQVALEHLAVLSVIARWVEEAELVEAAPRN
jgi:Protein of unknown function (Hypoth_ymh)